MTIIGITATSANVMKMRRKIGILLKNFIMTTSDPSQTTTTHNEIAQANVPFCSVQELQKKWNTTMKVPPKSASSILLCCSRIAMSYKQNRQDAYCPINTRYAIIVTLRGCALDKGFSAPLMEYLFVGLSGIEK